MGKRTNAAKAGRTTQGNTNDSLVWRRFLDKCCSTRRLWGDQANGQVQIIHQIQDDPWCWPSRICKRRGFQQRSSERLWTYSTKQFLDQSYVGLFYINKCTNVFVILMDNHRILGGKTVDIIFIQTEAGLSSVRQSFWPLLVDLNSAISGCSSRRHFLFIILIRFVIWAFKDVTAKIEVQTLTLWENYSVTYSSSSSSWLSSIKSIFLNLSSVTANPSLCVLLAEVFLWKYHQNNIRDEWWLKKLMSYTWPGISLNVVMLFRRNWLARFCNSSSSCVIVSSNLTIKSVADFIVSSAWRYVSSAVLTFLFCVI